MCAAHGARGGWAELGREALGVAREHRRLADVVQAEEEHDHALEPHAAARVREGAILEGVDVRLDGAQVDGRLLGRGIREEHVHVVDALGARGDLVRVRVRVRVRGRGRSRVRVSVRVRVRWRVRVRVSILGVGLIVRMKARFTVG